MATNGLPRRVRHDVHAETEHAVRAVGWCRSTRVPGLHCESTAEILTAKTTVGEECEYRAFGASGEVGEIVSRVRVDTQRQHARHHRRCCAHSTVKTPGHRQCEYQVGAARTHVGKRRDCGDEQDGRSNPGITRQRAQRVEDFEGNVESRRDDSAAGHHIVVEESHRLRSVAHPRQPVVGIGGEVGAFAVVALGVDYRE